MPELNISGREVTITEPVVILTLTMEEAQALRDTLGDAGSSYEVFSLLADNFARSPESK